MSGLRSAAIRGIGQSAVGRRLGRSGLDLTVEAAGEAIADAGLTPSDIDGIATYPGGGFGAQRGFSGPGAVEVQDAMRLTVDWYTGSGEGPGQLNCLVNACMAVVTGLARNVLVYRTVTEATEQVGGRGAAATNPVVGGPLEWLMPFGSISAVHWLGVVANRYVTQYGLTREQLAQVALTARRNAGLNPKAVYRDPLTLEDYLAARMISTPLCLYDCDVPADGSTAFVVSHADAAADSPNLPVRVEAAGTALRGRPSWDQWASPTRTAMHDAGASLWERTDLTPADVDLAQLYDGFSILTVLWLEAMGFCGEGEAGEFLAGGRRIALDGELPLNTAGGQLSAGRLHGLGLVHEACLQLRGQAGERQVRKRHEVAAVGNGGGPIGGALLLTTGLG
ncbi:MAG: acetyl-CoA acetyltransferase [Frankiales bacterium]|nr:acetyl-CoA acetyltransferase [Frankiales bacterium]